MIKIRLESDKTSFDINISTRKDLEMCLDLIKHAAEKNSDNLGKTEILGFDLDGICSNCGLKWREHQDMVRCIEEIVKARSRAHDADVY